ncbi:MAG: sugar phosphate nucleotidyltransferase [Bacteroidales bacterium]|nr:sugar phosphate nucleotidyltransferase [Bacteroidales bacterium]
MKPILLIMAAGIGSRYGNLKQIDRIGPSGETILDYSVFDALRSGFKRVVFIIRKDIEKDFREVIFDRLEKKIPVSYIFQELEDIPAGFTYPSQRLKPWGTGHAVWTARHHIHSPFCAINADDFYGLESFQNAVLFFEQQENQEAYCLMGYLVRNTLSEHGSVTRGVCQVDHDDYLIGIEERFHILKTKKGIIYRENEQDYPLDENTIVSMNMWGFTPSLFDFLDRGFREFLQENASLPKAEFLLPSVINDLLQRHLIRAKILKTNAIWFGLTYHEDRQKVIDTIRNLVSQGLYPASLWD